jgi:hypothetical protein
MAEQKPTIFYLASNDEYPSDPVKMGYQHAEITVFYSIGVPSSCSNGLFRLTYQRNYEENTKNVSHWYGETMENISDPRYSTLKDIAGIFGKMEKYLEKIKADGLTIDATRNDDYNWRIALLKKIGAFPVDWNKETHKYSSYAYSSKMAVKV